MNRPKILGITGGIGSGKSLVCKIFNHLGIPSYDSDSRAKSIMQSDQVLVSKIKDTFGSDIYQDGVLDRSKLGSIVFNNPDKLELLNSLVHPAVAKDFDSWVSGNLNQKILIKEAALLVETGSYKELDHLVVVTAPKDIRIKRVLERDQHRSLEDLERVITNQLDESQKSAVADFVINNDEMQLLIPQVIKVFEKINQ